ncbi:long chain fatty alcohol oxidase [Fusarium beomiforme]|uniref:Long-chain-alcohol oxidase n=1 Tax=Fusarium beomiforme TaxID=44412 RepID=A0A9P5AL38_9HYPO|nr:long chain fatty alcohol oxidase [Fusarium beomiforme]
MTDRTSIGLPRGPASEPLTEAQWQVLMAIMDTIIAPCPESSMPSIQKNAVSDSSTVKAFLAETPSNMPLFQEILKRVLAGFPPDKLSEIGTICSLLRNRVGVIPLTGKFTLFCDLSIGDRTLVLHSWRTSSLATFRNLFKQLSIIGKHVYLRSSSLFNQVVGFSSTPPGWHPVESYPFEFMQFNDSAPKVELDTDVVIVGSGCGAGVVARTIAMAGYRVLVVDKGHHYETSSLPLDESSGYFHLFEQGGLVSSEDGSISTLAGSCFGGGGTVNWSACLQPQNTVRDEWADKKGLGFFKSPEFQAHLDSVCERMGVSNEPINHNHGNSVLLEGARRLGYSAKQVPQNTGHCEHQDGYCSLGCWMGKKQGPVNGWLPDAARCGATFITGLHVNKVLFQKRGGKEVACGVTGTWKPRDGTDNSTKSVTIKAKRVVISAGSLCSPVILKNSGLKNKHIGRNLHLHPTSFVSAVFEQETRPWEGGILTSVVSSFDDIDGNGHGVRLERPSMLPSTCLTWCNWTSGPDYKAHISKYRHMEAYIAITRDRDSGHITIDPVLGTPRLVYTPSKFDTSNNLKGILGLAKILYTQGALEIHPVLPGLEPFIRHEENLPNDISGSSTATDVRFSQWLKKMESHGNKTPDTPYGSAHQMGTCRMSTKEADGVVDEFGKVWGYENLFVADASVFPSASGVNPMVTTMAICEHIGSAMVRDLAFDLQERPRL